MRWDQLLFPADNFFPPLITLVDNFVSIPFKIQGDSCSFYIAESYYDNQIALSTNKIKGQKTKLKKNFVCYKK